jgi:hypothetical protein
MSESSCPREPQVLLALGRGPLDDDLTAHVAQCRDCGDLAVVSAWMQAAEEPRELAVDLEQASRIWKVADAERRREQAAKALIPLAVGEVAACLFGGLALLGFAARYLWSVVDASQAVGVRLLADPVVWPLAGIVAVLLVGASAVSLALILGLSAARSQS